MRLACLAEGKTKESALLWERYPIKDSAGGSPRLRTLVPDPSLWEGELVENTER